jgi:hypothetical protein
LRLKPSAVVSVCHALKNLADRFNWQHIALFYDRQIRETEEGLSLPSNLDFIIS